MKKIILTLIGTITVFNVIAHGVALVSVDSASNSFVCLELEKTTVSISVNNQVAIFKSTQRFKNNLDSAVTFKYAFPMPETGSAIMVRWKVDSIWNEATLVNAPQDTGLLGDSGITSFFMPDDLDDFLGETPFYFPVDYVLDPNSTIEIELTYVQLLPYYFNRVYIDYPGRYNLIQQHVDTVQFSLDINSYRNIDSLEFTTFPGQNYTLNGNTCTIEHEVYFNHLSDNYQMYYVLAPDDLGFFSFSTYYPDSVIKCDTINGFFTFIVEPNSEDNSDIISKDFVLIIDKSGSMSGDKIQQARDAASFIINHLNIGDRFNIVKFDSDAETFSNQFMPFNSLNQSSALSYISNITAGGGTNIIGSFDAAVPMFANSPDDHAKIIIFFTDGQGSASTSETLSHVHSLVNTYAPDLNLFTFGIGSDVNEQLLSGLATQNGGLAEFLEGNDFSTTISNFYLTIQSPVMLNISMSFNPDNAVELYPEPLPNLYKGQQLIVSGRYNIPGPVQVTLNGTAFGQPVTYQYDMMLADTTVAEYSFLTKLWAKQKIDNLMNSYYNYTSSSPEAEEIRETVVGLSICWGVVSPFTSFEDDFGGGGLDISESEDTDLGIIMYPNPTDKFINLLFTKLDSKPQDVEINIYDFSGRLIYTLLEEVNKDNNSIRIDLRELGLSNGIYFVKVNHESSSVSYKVIVGN